MSNETTNPVLKWILIGVVAVSLCVVSAFVLLITPLLSEYRAADELKARGFTVEYGWQCAAILGRPTDVSSDGLNITPDDCRLICRLPRLISLAFDGGDVSGLNLDEIGNCPGLAFFWCGNVTQFPVDEIGKLAASSLRVIQLINVDLKDSDLEKFAKWTAVDCLNFEDNVEITDAGLEHLEKITTLEQLRLSGTSVTKEGVDEFKKKRPDVEVIF